VGLSLLFPEVYRGSVQDEGYPSTYIDIKKTKKNEQRKSREKKAVDTQKDKKKLRRGRR
jgi:hypothetical protein